MCYEYRIFVTLLTAPQAPQRSATLSAQTLNEVLLQTLIGQVDAELLEGVSFTKFQKCGDSHAIWFPSGSHLVSIALL